MRFSTKLASALLALALPSLLAAPIAAQAAPAVGVDDVVGSLGLASEPADYVVLVDTSGSMNQGGRYPAVRRELRRLLSSLDSDDRVSLLAFGSTASRRYRGKVGNNPETILAKLPASATGNHTDIGAAIEGGLTELESADTHRLAALILITDGELDTSPGAKYANVHSSAWRKLKTRATTLARDHDVAAYAVSLMATTDAALLKKVLPQASEVRATEVGTRFAQVGDDLVRLRAAKALRDELAAPITVAWAGDLGAVTAGGGPVPIQLHITSPYPHVPVVLTSMAAQAPAGLIVAVSGLPENLSLKPGGSATVMAEMTVTGSPSADATVVLTAKVTSPWSNVLEKDLGVQFIPTIVGATTLPPAPIKLPPTLLPTVGAIAIILALGAIALLLGRTLLTPRIGGVLSFSRNGRLIADVVVRGRRAKLVAPAGVTELAGLTGALVGARGTSRGQPAVRLTARLGGQTARTLVGDGHVIQMGDMEIAYISDHRRILDKIGLPATSSFQN